MRYPRERGTKVMLRIISLMLAVLIWVSFSGRLSEPETLQELTVRRVPLVYENKQSNTSLDIDNYLFQVDLTGTDQELNQLRTEDVIVRLSLEAASEGINTFSITKENVTLPPRFKTLSVTDITPDSVDFTITETMEKDVPVIVIWKGEPAKNFEVTDVKVSPSRVTLQGPKTKVQQLSQLLPDPLDVSDLREDLRGPITIDRKRHLGEGVAIKGNPVITYRVIIQEKQKVRSIEKAYVLDAVEFAGYVLPQTDIKLALSGPISLVDWFDPEWVLPRVTQQDLDQLLAERTNGSDETTSLPGEQTPIAVEPPLLLPIKEGWLVPETVRSEDPDWFIKCSQLAFRWIPEKVEVVRQ